jgi:hypothetical protein
LAVKQNGLALYYVPDELRTKELCELAIQQDGEALQYVPDKLRTKELCELAVKQNSIAFQFVIDKFKDGLQHYVKNKIFELPMEKYQDVFQEIKTIFPEKNISLNIK